MKKESLKGMLRRIFLKKKLVFANRAYDFFQWCVYKMATNKSHIICL